MVFSEYLQNYATKTTNTARVVDINRLCENFFHVVRKLSIHRIIQTSHIRKPPLSNAATFSRKKKSNCKSEGPDARWRNLNYCSLLSLNLFITCQLSLGQDLSKMIDLSVASCIRYHFIVVWLVFVKVFSLEVQYDVFRILDKGNY